jgi:hypothetical protein
MAPRPDQAKLLPFPDLRPQQKRDLLGTELGTSFDMMGQRLFAYYGAGDVFDYLTGNGLVGI